MHNENRLTEFRKQAVREIIAAHGAKEYVIANAETLFALDLTMYSTNYTLDSTLYNAISASHLDKSISLHPDQYKALKLLENNEGLILSAPTSFGKTFVVFEYIARYQPKTVFLVVPTLALIDEYKRKLIRKYKELFNNYKIFTSVNSDIDYSEYENKMFIVTHDRVLEESSFDTISEIDLLVIDEVYKLDRKSTDDRKLILNFAYYYLVQKSKKHILLAPFISSIENIDRLTKHPLFFKSDFSPVVNDVIECPIYVDNTDSRFVETNRIINTLPSNAKTLVYFANAADIPKYVENYSNDNFQINDITEQTSAFINWLSEEIHPKWYVVEAMKRGFLVHCGDLQLGIRNMQLDVFETENEPFNIMLCTSTLLEGVNTSTENIIITKPSRGYGNNFSNDFEAFDFFNLVGRSGRLFKTNLGTAYYIKAPTDPSFSIDDAIKSIEFEITSDSKDVKIQKNECDDADYLELLKNLHCGNEEYKAVVGYTSFEKVKALFDSYNFFKGELLSNIKAILESPTTNSRAAIIYVLLQIFNLRMNAKYNPYLKHRAGIVNMILNRSRLSIRRIVDSTLENLGTYNRSTNQVISDVIKAKNAYVEYDFSKFTNIVLFFMKQQGVSAEYTDYIIEQIQNSISYIYYKNEPLKRVLKESGIYEKDIDVVAAYAKDCGEDVNLIRTALKENYGAYKDQVSFLTRYSINRM